VSPQHLLNRCRAPQQTKKAVVGNRGLRNLRHVAGLKSGHIRAAGLDVYHGEPKVNAGYLTLENVTLLPHLGSASIEMRDAMGHRALENLDAVLLKGTAAPDRVV
jgi:lactate dehydrogenase-like 2-hydroxyacid dehydrogenase